METCAGWRTILPSSAQAPAKPSWAELALFLVNPATHPHPHRESLFYTQQTVNLAAAQMYGLAQAKSFYFLATS